MNKNSVNNVVEFMVKVLIVFGIVIGVIIFTLIILFMKEIIGYHKRGEEKIQIITDEYPAAIENHLESKYGEKFIINPKWIRTGGGSPIPFSEDGSPIYYEVHTEEEPDFGFRVYLFPMSDKDCKIKEIRDSYCWKFFREQIKKYFESRIEGVITQEYKLVVNVNPNITFANSINQYSSTESYFRYVNGKVSLRLYLILNKDEELDHVLLRNEVYQIMEKFYDKYDENMYIYFTCFKAESQDDFKLLDERKKENTVFVKLSDYPSTKYNSWGVNLKNIFTIKDFAYKSNEG